MLGLDYKDHKAGDKYTVERVDYNRPYVDPLWTNHVPSKTVNLKATLILVPNSLVGQWEDEIRKFAPGLNVGVCFGGKKASVEKKLDEYDVVISAPGTSFCYSTYNTLRFHRVILDESYGFKNKGHKAFCRARYIWCATATPFSSSLGNLYNHMSIMNISNIFPENRNILSPKASIVPTFQRFMIRHTKNMRIGGEKALNLPDQNFQTIHLDMTEDERTEYNKAVCYLKKVLTNSSP